MNTDDLGRWVVPRPPAAGGRDRSITLLSTTIFQSLLRPRRRPRRKSSSSLSSGQQEVRTAGVPALVGGKIEDSTDRIL